MTLEELFALVPVTLDELTTEFVRRGEDVMRVDEKSQLTACYLLGLRNISMLTNMGLLLRSTTRDGYDVLARAHMEARDLLMTFRFDDNGARRKIGYWFAGHRDSSWHPDHEKVNDFLVRNGADNLALSTRWSMMTVLSHPTFYAAEHSAAGIVSRVTGRAHAEESSDEMRMKRADFILAIARFISAVTVDLPGWISLGTDNQRMPHVEAFRQDAELIAMPFLNQEYHRYLPERSYAPPTKKAHSKKTRPQ
jgi:hypothetical protein